MPAVFLLVMLAPRIFLLLAKKSSQASFFSERCGAFCTTASLSVELEHMADLEAFGGMYMRSGGVLG